MTLDEIAAQEDELRSLMLPHGYFEERGPQVEAAGLPERWQEVLASYLELVGHDPDGLETLWLSMKNGLQMSEQQLRGINVS